MDRSEAVLRTLHLNLIPSPRVVSPGPATTFPLLFRGLDRSEQTVASLREARALAGEGNGAGRGFFLEGLPVSQVVMVRVEGFAASPRVPVAVRAAYCLGFHTATVSVGMGDGGPWVLGAEDASEPGPGYGVPTSPVAVEFVSARAEFLRVDPRTGRPEHHFHSLDWDADAGRPAFPAGAGADLWRWVSSPAPFDGMPLATRLRFHGAPDPGFVRLLDRTVAAAGALASPVDEARRRNSTAEGLLGSIEVLPDGDWEYLCVPSLLWNPPAFAAMVALAQTVTAACDRFPASSGPRDAGLDENFAAQRAYYHCDKAYLTPRLAALFPDLPVASPSDPGSDIRPAWGLEAPVDSRTYVVLRHRPDKATVVECGARQVRVPIEDIAGHDFVEDGPLAGWASRCGAEPVEPGPALRAELALPRAGAYRAIRRRSPGGGPDSPLRLRIGPVLGIMAPPEAGPRRFGIETDRFREIIKGAASEGMLAYVFFPDGDGAIKGWLYREDTGWSAESVPPPDVVYDRHIPDPTAAGATGDIAAGFLQRHPGTLFLNSLEMVGACRDKYLAHAILSTDAAVSRHLPETIAVESAAQAAGFAARRQRTYLKLRGGTGSKGLIVVEKSGPGQPGTPAFRLVTRGTAGQGAPVEAEAMGEEGLAGALENTLGPAAGSPQYIAQQGIDLAKVPGPGEAFEVRVVCQKGGSGRWLRTGMVCRMNPAAGRFLVPREELHVRVDDVLTQVFPGAARDIKETIRDLARRIPPLIEGASGRGGEMSVDLGIDTAGKPWLIEVNSKPATLFRDIAAFRLRGLSLRRLVNYAAFLFDNVPD